MKNHQFITGFISRLKIFYILGVLISFSNNSSLEEVQASLKEIAYAYYMRGPNIQYNDAKYATFPPEEATDDNLNYLVCSIFIKNIYNELLNISFPFSTSQLMEYTKTNLGSPEVIAYSYINNNQPEMKVYSPTEENNIKTILNPTVNDIIKLVKIDDVLIFSGHAQIIYDIIKDSNDQPIDAIIMHSTQGTGYINSKIPKENIKLSNGAEGRFTLFFLYLNSKNNSDFEEGLIEGSIKLTKLSNSPWAFINDVTKRKSEYSILRFIHQDTDGNAILKYKTSKGENVYNKIIDLSNKNIDRINFKHLYIEKLVNSKHNNIVEIGDILTYKIIIKNLSKKDYTNNLIVKEYLSEYVTFESNKIENEDIIFNFDEQNKELKWDIGKLKKGVEIIISYSVKITSGKSKDVIISLGYVNNIPSTTIKNVIGNNLNKKQMDLIVKNYDNLKNNYTGKILINEIYKKSFNLDMKFHEFDITDLIINSELDSMSYKTIYLNKSNNFNNAILNNYWSSLRKIKYEYIPGQEVNIYCLKEYRSYTSSDRREDFIYKEVFKTGDILLYINKNDSAYSVDKNQLLTDYITYEDGEYAYIYIDGKGFVGVNLGDDKLENTKDDRNEFNGQYYKNNKLNLLVSIKNPNDEFVETANMQTLFGKDYYVILRPSLCFNFTDYNDTDSEHIDNKINDTDSEHIDNKINDTDSENPDNIINDTDSENPDNKINDTDSENPENKTNDNGNNNNNKDINTLIITSTVMISIILILLIILKLIKG